MSYISATRVGDEVHVWERVNGVRKLKKYAAPWDFYVEDPDGTDKSLFGQKLSLVECDTKDEFDELKKRCISQNIRLYESDIQPELKILARHYADVPAPKLNITFYDIEVDYDKKIGFSSVNNPYAPVNAVALHHYWLNKSVVLAVPPPYFDMETFDKSLHDLSEIIFCRNEKELLQRFLDQIVDSDAISGWNSAKFDAPYLLKRIERVLGKEAMKRMNFPEAKSPPRFREMEVGFGRIAIVATLTGRLEVDFMELFKKFEMEKRASYALAYVADELLPHLPKLEYTGTLADLYKNDFNWFIRYNIRDTEILKGFEDRLGYVDLANVMYHSSTGKMDQVFGTIRLADLAIVNYCHNTLGVKVPDWVPKDDGSIKGALVLYPQIGLQRWTGSVDINSLYPSAIRSLNISPETLIGQFTLRVEAWEMIRDKTDDVLLFEYEDGTLEERTAAEWREYMLSKKWAVSGYGTVFDQNKMGVIPALLAEWYSLRKKYQALKVEHGDKRDAILGDRKKEQLTDPEEIEKYEYEQQKYTYYDRLQYVYKIKLNSTYGALTNYNFRFFDLRTGESTTGTGRQILKHQVRKIAETLDGNYNIDFPLYGTVGEAIEKGGDIEDALHGQKFKGKFQSESIVYGDTDSCYFKTHGANQEEATKVADYVANVVNKSFPNFMRSHFLCTEGYDTLIKSGREVISDAGIFVDKKRYVLHLVDLDGKKVDKLKVMGLEMRKTTTPKPIQDFLKKTVTMILSDVDWEEIDDYILTQREYVAKDLDIMDIGLPKGIKGVEEYTPKYWENIENKKLVKKHRIPGHVMAAIHYNECLNKYDDKESMPIASDMKIKVYYLKHPVDGFKNIALPTDIERIPDWFLQDEYQIDRRLQSRKLVDANLKHIFDAIGRDVPTSQSKIIDQLFEW